ncbi:MAG: Flp pilus assembly protein CpaB [Verrucomicrobia bacterium]|nr:Flp pilus assembly protein CpaB [Verrucomicrobiota bacterium]
MKQKMVLLISVVIGLTAFWATHQYLRSERARIYKGAQKIKVLVARSDLAAGTVLQVEDLASKSLFKAAVGENVFSPGDLDTVLGKKLRYSLRREEPLWWSHVDVPIRDKGGLAALVMPGMRAVSIAVGGADAVSGLVKPNDHVDILGTFTMASRKTPGETETVTLTVLQDVTVLATGQRLGRDEFVGQGLSARSSGYSVVTLEVTPREGELLVFAQKVKGSLTLSLRNSDDVSFEKDLPEVDFQHIENKLPELNTYRQRHIRHKTDL